MAASLLSRRQVEIRGLKEIQQNLQRLVRATDGSAERIWQISAAAAEAVKREVEAGAKSVRTPSDVFRDLFSTRKPKPFAGGERQITQLAGIRLRGRSRPYAHAYREWRARASFTRIRIRGRKGNKRVVGAGTVQQGQLLGMSLASMWERGTSRMRARKFFGPAVSRARAKVAAMLASEFRRLLEESVG
ncbi:MAG: hypothetical protein KatS3mg005_2045 [Bryobacteraceae bacterium]|nr:MAG: hypothetical protein KatS3mg005_2045 [Bryobacteraceae bacterium]